LFIKGKSFFGKIKNNFAQGIAAKQRKDPEIINQNQTV